MNLGFVYQLSEKKKYIKLLTLQSIKLHACYAPAEVILAIG